MTLELERSQLRMHAREEGAVAEAELEVVAELARAVRLDEVAKGRSLLDLHDGRVDRSEQCRAVLLEQRAHAGSRSMCAHQARRQREQLEAHLVVQGTMEFGVFGWQIWLRLKRLL